MNRFAFVATVGISVLVGTLTFVGCKNGNLFGGLHDRGDSGKIEYLLSDAAVALRGKDYSSALALYERILAQDPNNSEALYGAATAAIGSSGLNFATILSNVVSQTSTLSIMGLADFVAESREGVRSNAAGPTSILRGVNIESLSLVIDRSICRLNKIATGRANGQISTRDIDVIVNLGVLYTLRAVVKPLNYNLIDITNTAGSYQVDVKVDLNNNVCDGSQLVGSFSSAGTQQAFIQGIITDIANGYSLLNKAALILNISGDRIIPKVRADVSDAVNDLLTDGSMPANCVTQFNNAGISSVNDLNNWNAWESTPPSGC